MNSKLVVAAIAAGFGFGLNGALAQSVNLQGPQITQQETKPFLQTETFLQTESGNGRDTVTAYDLPAPMPKDKVHLAETTRYGRT